MNPKRPSRRRLLGSLLAATIAALCPWRPQVSAAATRRPARPASPPRAGYSGTTVDSYDPHGRLTLTADFPHLPAGAVPLPLDPQGSAYAFVYFGD